MSDQADDKPLRLTKDVRKQVIAKNEGYTTRTYYQGKNSREERIYKIKDNKVHVRSIGKTSWADSRYDTEGILDEQQEHRFLRNNLGALDTSGIQRSTSPSTRTRHGKPSHPTPSTPLDLDDYDANASYSLDDQADDGEDPLAGVRDLIGAAALLVGIVVAREAAPHVKRLWTDHAAPRIRSARNRIQG